MKVIPLRPSKQNIQRWLLLSLLLILGAVFIPWFFVPAAFLMPLVCCPALPGAKKPFLYSLCCALGILVGGFITTKNFLVALGFSTVPLACCGLTLGLLGQKQTLPMQAYNLFFSAYLFAQVLILLALGAQYPQGVITGLAEEMCNVLKNHQNRDAMLYQLAFQGVLPKPEGFPQDAGFLLGVDAGVAHQLFLSAKAQLLQGVAYWLPLLLVKGGIVFSLFTFLRVRWVLSSFLLVEEGSEKVTIARPPVFSMLRMRWSSKLVLFGGMLLGMLLSGEGVMGLFGSILYHASRTTLSLMGAAFFLRLLAQGKDRPGAAAGVLAGLVWLTAEELLILLLVFESVLRKIFLQKPQDDKEEKQQ